MNASDKDIRPEGAFPPAFWTPLTEEDHKILEFQRKGRRTDSSKVLYAAARCRFGCPQAVVSAPVAAGGSPFPTVFWLTCPYLNKRCGELESAQKIAELEALFAEMPEEINDFHKRYAALRIALLTDDERRALPRMNEGIRRVLEESGIGGINWKSGNSGAKCLHLQTAAWLGMGWHPAGAWLKEQLGAIECETCLCRPEAGYSVQTA